MTDVMKMSRKALTMGVVLATILWSMMASILVAPLKASAAGCTSGSLIKGSLAAVYYCGSDGKRYVFTNDKAYFTWYPNFNGVVRISDADLASVQIGGNVTYRPGVKMLKIQSDPKVYAIGHGGVLRPIPSEACAATLYGSTWNKQIDDVSDAFFTNYSVGTAIDASCSNYNKTAEMSSSQSINQDKGLSTAGVSGTASVTLAADSPAGATLPKGSTGVNVLKFNVTNSGPAMTVDSVTLRRVGPGATTDISSVYLYEGAARLTTGRSVNSSTNEVNFTGLNLALAAGQTRTLWVAVDISTSASAGNVHAFELSKAMSGVVQLSGSPFTGNNFTLAGTTVGTLTIAKTGTITAPKAGEMGAKIAEFSVTAGSSEDIRLDRLTLFQGGNLAGANLTNLKLKQAGLTVATAAAFDSNLRATFTFSAPGMLLEKGAVRTFQVFGDIGGGARASDSLKIYVEESADLHGIGQTFGQGATVTRTAYDGDSCTSSSGDCSYSTVEAGQVTVTFLGPSSKDIAKNVDNTEVFRFTMVAQSNIEVRNLRMNIAASADAAGASGLLTTSNAANYTDIKVTNVATGASWWGPKDVTGTDGTTADNDGEQDLVFNDVQTLQAGVVYTFAVTLDVESTATAAETITMRLDAFSTSDLRNLDNSTFLTPSTDVVPGSALTGNAMTVRAASLVISLGSTPVSQTYIKGATNVNFTGVNLAAGTGADVTVTAITATGWIDDAGTTTLTQGYDSANGVEVRDIVTSCRLMDGATQVGVTKSPTASTAEGSGGLLEFTGLNLVIPASQTKSLMINCDISNSAYQNSNAETLAFSIETATEPVVQDKDGNSVDPTGTANASGATVRITTASAGTMSYILAPADTESEAGLVIAGSTAVLGKIRLTASNEELKQTKLNVALATAGNQNSVVSMSLYDGAQLVAGPVPLSSGIASFSGFNFVVPKDSSKTLTVKAVLNTIAGGATSGADLAITVDLSSPTAGTFEYRGTSSSTVVTTIASTDVTGATKILRKTKPTVSLVAINSTLVNGSMVLGRITVAADSAEQVSLKSIQWTVGRSDAANVTFTSSQSGVREYGQGSNITGTAVNGCTAASTNTSCTFLSVFTSEQVIAAGTSKTYELVLTVAGAGSNDTIATNIASDTALVTGELATSYAVSGDSIDDLDGTNAGTATYNLTWSDNSVVAHNATVGGSPDGDDSGSSNDWTNGLYVKVLPTDTQTVLFP